MIVVEGVLQNKTGFHIRPAQLFMEKANEFKANIMVRNEEGMEADGKSILGLMTMGFEYGSKIVIEASGDDEEIAVKALLDLVNNKFGEE
ncbi:Phosphocarrier protein NPr [Sporomusa silvacetica DSM 10669]|uniref:Phosphocarrier protein NPr n=1 Tax=Sporomusa silvacetica DSM 10669 TaxID=1123289 RepID=A0ABZ3ITL7_9FIRM|nr:HPr family phosphocarrier protein [Sporomusa silvacetica]OZC19610.1 phosphocarrier protein NPr [Sporomusa silvacetica DSM 10669]